MVDKVVGNTYLWYSGATDVTGKKLAEALGCKHGSEKPTAKDNVCAIVGWGIKSKNTTGTLPGAIPILNTPDKIALNRNKVAALAAMAAAGVNVAPFVETGNVKIAGNQLKAGVMLPVIGRTNYHQGGKGFWNCPTMTHVRAAIDEGAGYFQNLIEIKDEFRLHTFGDKVIYAVKKVKRTVEEMEDAYIKQETERQEAIALKNGETLDKATMVAFLRRQAKKFAQDGANMLIRSNRLGWKFVHVKTIDSHLEAEAVKALKAIGLDFGAVDCCIDATNKAWVIEVNSGPGLEETSFNVWVEAFRSKLNSILQPATDIKANKESKSKDATIIAKASVVGASTKQSLAEKVKLMSEMVEKADEEETSVLNNIFKKMFG
jgi:glutathione synthase/RimK-type ligase-like ATP-grasp enzyme